MTVRQIRKNAVRQIKGIISNMSDCVVHTDSNNYKGAPYSPDAKELKLIMEDVQLGHAVLADVSKDPDYSKNYMLKYAGKCRWYFN